MMAQAIFSDRAQERYTSFVKFKPNRQPAEPEQDGRVVSGGDGGEGVLRHPAEIVVRRIDRDHCVGLSQTKPPFLGYRLGIRRQMVLARFATADLARAGITHEPSVNSPIHRNAPTGSLP
jgi:hypothetical protein